VSLAAIMAMFVGEALCIYAELLIARGSSWWWTFFLITLAGVPLLFAYKYGYASAESAWPVMVTSVVSVLIVEPVLVWVMFHERPSWGSVAGLACGALGLFFTLRY
jgi:drug/metabolite transporter (DMT)-like permease